VVMFAMLYGQLPFKGITTKDIKEKIFDGKGEILFVDSCSREAIDLMKKMLDRNPETRIDIREILNHPWLADVGSNDNYRVFTKAERVTMIKEFFVAEDEMHWRYAENVKMNEIERMELHDGYDIALLNSTASGELTHHSTKSLILAPNNSTLTNEGETDGANLERFARTNGMWVDDRHDIIIWEYRGCMKGAKKAKLTDAKYEREHNVNVDNGVIKEDADET